MKTIRITLLAMASIVIGLVSCQKSGLSTPDASLLSSSVKSSVADICGAPVKYDLIDANHKQPAGSVTVSNNQDNVFITVEITYPDFKLSKVALVAGTLDHVKAATNGTVWSSIAQGPQPPDYTQTFKPEVSTYTFTLPAGDYEDCFYLNVIGQITKRDPNTGKLQVTDAAILASNTRASKHCWSSYVEYCKQACETGCGQLRTQTQGGWGAPNGAPHDYLYANFAAAFPSGVTIGSKDCADGHTLTMTTPVAITNNLPTIGTPGVLTQDYLDAVPSKNVLVGQLVTLALNIGFDNYDATFGDASVHLGDMIIGSGDFQGKTVNEFLAIADAVIAGCNTDYTPAQVNSVADLINNNYDNGTIDNGYLVCPGQ